MLDKLTLLNLLCATEIDSDVQETEVEENQVTEVQSEQIDTSTEPSYTLEQIESFKRGHDSYQEQLEAYKHLETSSKEAMELYNYLNSNKELAKKLYEYDMELQGSIKDKMPSSEKQEVNNLKIEIEKMKIDNQLKAIKLKDSSVSEVELLKTANDCKVDLDTAYKIVVGNNFDTKLKEALEKQKTELTNQIQQNANSTRTLINESDKGNDDSTYGLTSIELKYAEKMGMKPEEYAKWK